MLLPTAGGCKQVYLQGIVTRHSGCKDTIFFESNIFLGFYTLENKIIRGFFAIQADFRPRFSVEFMNNQSATKFRLKPCGLWRHYVSAVGNIHDLLHTNGIESERHFISPLSTRLFSSPKPRNPPTKSIRLSLRKSFMFRISSNMRREEISTSKPQLDRFR